MAAALPSPIARVPTAGWVGQDKNRQALFQPRALTMKLFSGSLTQGSVIVQPPTRKAWFHSVTG
jgi:hypothetical protein